MLKLIYCNNVIAKSHSLVALTIVFPVIQAITLFQGSRLTMVLLSYNTRRRLGGRRWWTNNYTRTVSNSAAKLPSSFRLSSLLSSSVTKCTLSSITVSSVRLPFRNSDNVLVLNYSLLEKRISICLHASKQYVQYITFL